MSKATCRIQLLNFVSLTKAKQNCVRFPDKLPIITIKYYFSRMRGKGEGGADVKIRLESCNNKVQCENFNADGKSIVESLYAEMTERSLFLVDSHNII